jgi:purine nucleosidase
MVQKSMAKPMECIVNTRRKLSLSIVNAVWVTLMTGAAACAKTPVLLSTDVGNEIDDQWAITYLLTNPDFDVQGITSAHAPSLPDPSAHATYRILVDVVEQRLGMAVHPALLEGASSPLKDNKTPQPSAALDFIIETSKHYSKDNRLTVLNIGAATDLASAIIEDPEIVDRIRVVAMGFTDLSKEGGKEYNVENDPRAWQVILKSDVPVVIGAGNVCRANLSLSFQQAATMVSGHGPIGAWLWDEYKGWYFRNVKPLRVNDFSKPWIIWDIITLCYLQRITEQKEVPRPVLGDDLSFVPGTGEGQITWITKVDSGRLWRDFIEKIDVYQRTHAVKPEVAMP